MNSRMQAIRALAVTPVPRISHLHRMCGLAACKCLSWHKPTKSTEIYRSVPACLNMKSRRLVERTVPKTRRLELVSRCFTWDPQPKSSHQHPNVVVLGSYKLRQKTSFGKSRRRSCLSVATPSSLPFRPFLVSRGGLTCCHAGLLGRTLCCTEAGVITAQRRNKTSNLQAWQNSSL